MGGQDEWSEEQAHQLGMGLGVGAYNDALGMGLDDHGSDCPSCHRPRVAGHHGCMCDEEDGGAE